MAKIIIKSNGYKDKWKIQKLDIAPARYTNVMFKNLLIILALLFVTGCDDSSEDSLSDAHQLSTFFDSTLGKEGSRVEVIGYYGFWNDDISVLYSSKSAQNLADGLKKSQIIFKHGATQPTKGMEGKACIFIATIWYRGTVLILDQAELKECRE